MMVVSIEQDSSVLESLGAVVVSLGPDLLFMTVVISALWLSSRGWWRRTLLSFAWLHSLFNAANLVSFRLTGSAMNWTRMRGGDGAKVTDFELVEWGDVIPGFALLTAILIFGIWLFLRRHRDPSWLCQKTLSLRFLIGLGAMGLGALVVQSLWHSPLLYGLAEYPPLAFGQSFFELDEATESLDPKFSWDDFLAAKPPRPGPTDQGPPSWSGPGPKNVILYFSEGIPLHQTSLGGCPLDTTPNLKKRAAQGVFFPRYYAPYAKSIHAIFSTACSEFPPPHHKAITKYNPRIDCGTLMEHLAKQDVAQGLFHGGHFSFGGKMKLLGDRGFNTTVDAYDILKKHGELYNTSWGVDDRGMVQAGLDWMAQLPPKQRFFAWFIPIAPHYPYKVPDDVIPPFPDNSREDHYRNAVHFADQAFEKLMQGLEAQGIADDTLVIWIADHGEAFGEHPRNAVGSRFIYEENVHVPMVWINPRMFPTAQTCTRLASHVDLAPTIMDFFAAPADPRHRGHSLLQKNWPTQRVILAAYQGRDPYVGFVEGDYKFIYRVTDGHSEYYNLRLDPQEKHDLSNKYPRKIRHDGAQAATYQRAQLAKLRKAPHKHAQRSDFLQALMPSLSAQIKTRGSKKWEPCDKVKDDGSLHCRKQPGWVYLGIKDEKIQGKRTTCVRAHIPKPGGTFAVKLKPKALQQSAGFRIGLCDGSTKKGGAPVAVSGAWQTGSDVKAHEQFAGTLTDDGQPLSYRWPQEDKNASFVLQLSADDDTRRCICIDFQEHDKLRQ